MAYEADLKNQNADRIMNFCMYCGTQLPDYIEEYDEELTKELCKLGITYEDIDNGKAKMPDEFLSDAWWKNRGIQGLGKWCTGDLFSSMKRAKSVCVTEE